MAVSKAVSAPRSTRTRLRGLFRSESGSLGRLLRWWPVWLALVLFIGALVADYQTPGSYSVPVGSPEDEAYVRNFHARMADTTPSYRWSDVYGYVAFPGVGGSRPFTITLTLDPGRGTPVQIFVNGEQMLARTFAPGWQTVTLHVDGTHPQVLQSRDTVVEIRSTDYRTEDAPAEPKGVKVSMITLEQDRQGGFIVPALAPVAGLSFSLLLVYLIVGRSLAGYASLSRARLWGLIALLLAGVAVVVTFVQARIGVAAASGHATATLITTLLIGVICESILRSRSSNLTGLQCRLLALSFAGAFLLRFGGMALPQAVIIDMPWHMKWLGTLLSGDWQSLYFPGGLSSVPKEWGMELLIPKSPLFYFAFAPLSVLPFDLETSVKWLISLLDASLALVVFRISTAVQPRVGAALAGAWLYAVMPLAFRAFAYGILPTILAQWLAAIFLLAIVVIGPRTWRPIDWAAMVVLALLVFLSFPTVALFVTLVISGYVVVLFLWRRNNDSGSAVLRLAVAALAGWLIAIWAYYGLYVSPVLASAQALLAPKASQAATVRWPGGFGDLVVWTSDYVVTLLPALLALAGLGLLYASRRVSSGRRGALLLVTLWIGIMPLFFLVNYRVDMIGKHLFFTMLPVALAGGVALYRLSRQGRWGVALASIALVLVAWQGLVFWIERLVRAST
jgi:hypothetical protein